MERTSFRRWRSSVEVFTLEVFRIYGKAGPNPQSLASPGALLFALWSDQGRWLDFDRGIHSEKLALALKQLDPQA